MVIQYSREVLFSLRKANTTKSIKLKDDVFVKINYLGIKKPYRGKRSGLRKKSLNNKSKVSFSSYAECLKFNLNKTTSYSLNSTVQETSELSASRNSHRHTHKTYGINTSLQHKTVNNKNAAVWQNTKKPPQHAKPNTVCNTTRNSNEWHRAKKSCHLNTSNIMQNEVSLDNRYDLLQEIHDTNIINDHNTQNLIENSATRKSRKSKAKSKKTEPNKKLHFNKMTLGFWNAQSVRKKASLVNDYTKSNKIDIYCIAESWIKKHHGKTISDLESIGTKVLLNPREGRTGGGTCCIHKKQLDITLIDTEKRKTFEHMELKLNIQSTLVTILIVYRPESSKKKRYSMDEFFTEFANFMTEYYLLKHEVIIVGDFNFHVNKSNDGKAKRFLELIKLFSFKNIITEPTHKDGNTLDLILIRENSILLNHKVDEQNSDHSNIIFSLNLEKPKPVTKTIKFRKTKEINMESFKKDIADKISETIDQNKDPEKYLLALLNKYNSMSEVLDKHAPVIEKTVIERNFTPWSRKDIIIEKRLKRKYERKWKRTRLEVDYQIYKAQRNKYNNLLNELTDKKWAKVIDENEHDHKVLYREIKKRTNKKRENPLPKHDSKTELANEFSDFFNDKIETIRDKLEEINQIADKETKIKEACKHDTKFKGQALSNFKLLAKESVKKLLKKAKNKTSNLDPMPTEILKECIEVDELLTLMTEIVNTSLKHGIFVDPLKHADIKPLIKKLGLALEKKNYRPVSNLSFISKIIEAAVVEQYIQHLRENDLLDDKQSAYKQYHSTETLLLKVQNEILSNMDNGEVTILVLLDLSAAFDTIDHDILLYRLEHMYGITGTVLKWFESYLSDRSQSVVIDGEKSKSKELKYGVPQGSKLGPLLFASYIAPLSTVVSKTDVDDEKFADDEQLALAFKPKPVQNQNNSKFNMEDCIIDVRDFLFKNMLANNGDKTEFLLVGSPQQLKKVDFGSIKVGNVEVKAVDKVRNLGVIFDKHMTMEDHVNKLSGTCFGNIKSLSEIRENISDTHAKIVTNAMVTSHLDYGNALLYGIHKKLTNKLQLVQNAAARVIDKKQKYDHITETRKKLHWLPMEARSEFKILKLTWQSLNDMAPKYLQSLITLKKPCRHNLRSNNRKLLEVPKRSNNSKYGDRAFVNAAPKLWNNLPSEVQNAPSLEIFKKKLKTHLFDIHYPVL